MWRIFCVGSPVKSRACVVLSETSLDCTLPGVEQTVETAMFVLYRVPDAACNKFLNENSSITISPLAQQADEGREGREGHVLGSQGAFYLRSLRPIEVHILPDPTFDMLGTPPNNLLILFSDTLIIPVCPLLSPTFQYNSILSILLADRYKPLHENIPTRKYLRKNYQLSYN